MLCKPQLYAGAIRHTFATPIALSRLGDDLAHDSMPLSTLKQTKTARGLIRKDQQQHGLSSGSDSDARWGTRPSGRRNLKAQLASGAVLFRFCLSGLGTPGGATLRPPGVQRCGPLLGFSSRSARFVFRPQLFPARQSGKSREEEWVSLV